MSTLGERFRAAREARGLSLSDVSEQIRIRSVYLAAIEEDNWNAIGAPVYIRGFLRTYARFLGLDPEEVVAAFNNEPAAQPAPPAQGVPRVAPAAHAHTAVEEPGRGGSLVVWAAGLVAILLIAFVIYNELT
ncbi:MAG: helix-turn-helix domain-containing protein, partial [Candidatus Eremiobacteraeota bacterium]|nr:helix-turn-helix domain-containing protein [Candidatus Eremiobacteraeota bacterium]